MNFSTTFWTELLSFYKVSLLYCLDDRKIWHSDSVSKPDSVYQDPII